MYENIQLLFANPILSLLTIVLTNQIFQNYVIFEEIEVIFLFTNGFLHYFQIKKHMLCVFFFQKMFVNESIKKIQKVCFFNNHIVNLSHQINYKKNIEIHDIQKKTFVKINDKFLNVF